MRGSRSFFRFTKINQPLGRVGSGMACGGQCSGDIFCMAALIQRHLVPIGMGNHSCELIMIKPKDQPYCFGSHNITSQESTEFEMWVKTALQGTDLIKESPFLELETELLASKG